MLNLRDIETPQFFIQVSEQQTRSSLMEALRQILEDGNMVEPLGEVPMGVAKIYERPL